MKHPLLVVFLFISLFCYSQENCNNGTDDDNDGKIDLNDSDCICNIPTKPSLLQNHSFEEKTGCPQGYDDTPTASNWTKGTIPSPDYLNKDCYLFNTIYSKNLQDFPDGKGIIRAVYKNNKKEYIANKLSAPLLTGVNYQLTLNIATLMSIERSNLSKNFDFNFLQPTYVTLYGCNNKNNLPLYTTSDPNSFDPSWIEIGKVLYQPQTAWGEITISFTTNTDINAIMLGPEKILSSSFNTDYEPSFLYDNLRLNTAENFGVTIVQSGSFCNNDLMLTANLTKTINLATTFQWYRNGIAINGATNKSYSIPSDKTNLGEYTVKVTDGSDCFISSKLTINNSIPNPSVTIIQPTCQDPNGYINVNDPGIEYSFYKSLPLFSDDYYVSKDLVWQTDGNFATTEYGKYYVQTRTTSGCVSTPTIVTLDPPTLLDRPTYSIIQPVCNSGGTITITTPGSQFSFDDGLTWDNGPTKTNLPAGNYLLKIKNSSGCESYSQNVLLFPPYIDSPAYTLTQPICNQGGSITITSPASEYSFDNGVTWTTNPTATNLPAGHYNVRIKNEFGCESKPYIYQIYLNPFSKSPPDFVVNQPNTCSNTGSIVFLNSTYKYSIDNGETWQETSVFNNLQPGNYLLKTQNELGCESQVSQVKINFYLSNPTYTIINPTCTSKGSITITSPASEYSFDNGETWSTNPTATNLPPGYYYIRIKNEIGCESDIEYAYLPVFHLDEPTFKITNPNCETESKWSISITTPAASYSFDGGLTWGSSPNISNLDYGFHFLKIKNSLGCESNYAVANIGNAYYLEAPEFLTIQPTCTTPASVTITTPAAFYSFDDGGTWSTNPNLTKYPNGGASGSLRIKNKSGCVSEAAWFNLNDNYLHTLAYTIVQPTTCDTNANGSITITTPADFYSFDGGLNWSTNPTASNLPAGFKYHLKIKNKEGCESGNHTIELTKVQIKAAEYKAIYPTCGKGGTITITTPAPFYSFDGGETWGINPTATNLPAGFYYPKIKNELGCESQFGYSINFNVLNTVPQLGIQVTQPTCESKNKGSITINTVAEQYSFDGGSTWSQHNTAINLSPGNYSILTKNNLGCGTGVGHVQLYPFYLPRPDYTTTAPTCQTTGSITVTTPAAAYSFDYGKTWGSNPTKSNLPQGSYNIIIKNELGCESEPYSFYLYNTNPPAQRPTISIQQPSSCTSSTGKITVTTNANLYSFDDGLTWSPNPVVTHLTTGDYFIRIKNSLNGCPSPSVKVTINPPLDAIITPNYTISQPISCTNPFGIINITTVAYAYSFDDGLSWTTTSNSGNLPVGQYKIRIKNSAGCESETVTIQINAPTDYPANPEFTTIQPDCNNLKGSITITSAAAEYSFDDGTSWTTNATQSSLDPKTYFIKVKNNKVCISNATTAVITPFTNFTPKPALISPQAFCFQLNATLNSISITGQNIKWYDSQTTGRLLANTTLLQNNTVYYATQTINGCESERAPVTINIQNTPAPTGSGNQSFCTSQNPTIATIQINGALVKWYDALANGNLLAETTNLQNGKAYYASQTVNGCESERFRVTVSIVNTPSDPTGNSNQFFCKNENATLSNIQISGQNIKWYDTNTATAALPNTTLLENNRTYYASQTVGCESDRTAIMVKVYDTALPTGNRNQQFCMDQNAAIANLTISGTALKWYDSTMNGTILAPTTLLQNGVYYVTQTLNNCESERLAVNVKIQDTQAPIADSPQAFCIQKNAKISNIKIEGQNIQWFESASSTVPLSESVLLENGITYYASQTVSNCEGERIPVAITIIEATMGDCINYVEELPFPKFFTPNNDGSNDFWTIDFTYLKPNTGIRIFDRYGKFIKELTPNTAWDGTYMGQNLPASDYWFVVTRFNGTEFRGHFSLKR
ncbi:T9SS type B sorting domain-containing protein [Flavobacterium limi]|uniref:Ig-like domain-containing protein n=1 Tax=Flavobacterium limi TaxID=2045105 RepID=A0ABQ1U7U7_9FLAO|nr:T9SS type B sorting domain-containing protein [Flavobacterium limi]GGF12322.1 hypothetical protein GCM10011518_21950 [Flavobacterium limi]